MGKPYLDIAIFAGNAYLNDANDPTPGKAIANTGYLFIQGYNGILGKRIRADWNEALMLSKTSVGTLYGGEYQYVQFKAGSTASNARGQLVFWDTLANAGDTSYVVTPDATSTNITQVAGVTLNAVDKGNYGWIQVWGEASVKALASLTNAAIGNIAFVDVTPTNTFDANTEASITIRQYSKKIGVCYQLPVNATVTRVWLQHGGAIVTNM